MNKRIHFGFRTMATIALMILLAALLSLVYMKTSVISKNDTVGVRAEDKQKNTHELGGSLSSRIENISSVSEQRISIEWVGSEIQKQELEAWALSRGKIGNFSENGEYDHYDNVTLEALAKNNRDIKAMTILGIRLRGEKGREWLNHAAVFGSSYALTWAGVLAAGIQPTESAEIKKEALVDALTYKKVAELRNDYYSSALDSIDLYESKLGITLSSEDKEIAEKKSHELYSQLEDQRVQLGLGTFDNSIPPAVKAYYKSRDYVK